MKQDALHTDTSNTTSFLITIHRRENHSWQGTIQWLESNQMVHFRSELEMLSLIQEATQKSQPKVETRRVWEEQKGLSIAT